MAQDLRLDINNKQILKLALPISFALLVPQINFITNNIFLGQLGVKELGAAGITGVYYLVFAGIGFGLNNGLQALISRRAGENRELRTSQRSHPLVAQPGSAAPLAGRDRTEEPPCKNRKQTCEAKHYAIELDLCRARQRCRTERDECVCQPIS